MDPSRSPSPAPQATEDRRGFLDRHQRAAVVAAILIIVAASGWLTYFYWPGPDLSPPVFNWYTVDDGATWFQDDAERIPPFEHEGKSAIRVHLYSCDGGKTTFVGYLQKLPEEVFQTFRDRGLDPQKVDDDELAAEGGWLAKHPGDGEWVNSKIDPARYNEIRQVKCPEGKKLIEVFPENPKK